MLQNKLGLKITLLIGSFLFLSLMGVGYIFFRTEKNLLLDSLSKRIDLIQKIVKTTLYYHIMPFGDFNKFKSYYAELNQLEDISSVRLIRGNAVSRQYGSRDDSQPVNPEDYKSLNGEEVTNIRKIDKKILMEKIVPIRADKICQNCHHVLEGEILGAISISLEIDRMLSIINQRHWVLFFSFLSITGVIFLFVFLIFRRSILNPVHELVQGYNEVSRGNLNIKVNVHSKDEIGMLTRSFNEMVRNLKTQHRAIIQSEKLASLGTLTAEVGHRINNPLAIIMMRVEHILDSMKTDNTLNTKSEQIIKDLEVVLKHGKEISKTVSSLLEISRVSKDDITEVNLNDVIKDSVEFVEKIAIKKGIKISINFNSCIPVVRCNRNDLQQVFLSMLFNSIDALVDKNNGDKRIDIEFLPQKKKNICQILLRDNGCGIPSEHLNRIFDPFFTTKETGKGTGLGLTIAYNIIQGMGGEIWVESKQGEGTTFSIHLPVVRFEGNKI